MIFTYVIIIIIKLTYACGGRNLHSSAINLIWLHDSRLYLTNTWVLWYTTSLRISPLSPVKVSDFKNVWCVQLSAFLWVPIYCSSATSLPWRGTGHCKTQILIVDPEDRYPDRWPTCGCGVCCHTKGSLWQLLDGEQASLRLQDSVETQATGHWCNPLF